MPSVGKLTMVFVDFTSLKILRRLVIQIHIHTHQSIMSPLGQNKCQSSSFKQKYAAITSFLRQVNPSFNNPSVSQLCITASAPLSSPILLWSLQCQYISSRVMISLCTFPGQIRFLSLPVASHKVSEKPNQCTCLKTLVFTHHIVLSLCITLGVALISAL